MRSPSEYIIDSLGAVIRAGGELAGEEQYRSRLEICKSCDRAGTVRPLPLISMEGCTVCGCPFRTKLKTLTHLDENLKRITTICPHPIEGNKWAPIDKKFKPNGKKS